MLVKMRSLSCSIATPSPRLLAKDADVLGFAALGERLGLLHPFLALYPALEAQVAVDPVALGLLPRGDLRPGVDAELVEQALVARADAGDHLEIVGLLRLLDAGRPVRIVERDGLVGGKLRRLEGARGVGRLAGMAALLAGRGRVGGGLVLRGRADAGRSLGLRADLDLRRRPDRRAGLDGVGLGLGR